jgi:hypothetical protein
LLKKRQNKKLPIFLKGRAEMIKVNKLFHSIFTENWQQKALVKCAQKVKKRPKLEASMRKIREKRLTRQKNAEFNLMQIAIPF